MQKDAGWGNMLSKIIIVWGLALDNHPSLNSCGGGEQDMRSSLPYTAGPIDLHHYPQWSNGTDYDFTCSPGE